MYMYMLQGSCVECLPSQNNNSSSMFCVLRSNTMCNIVCSI